jgi:DNA-directed RNA polymerase subunit RPC12/RpoP
VTEFGERRVEGAERLSSAAKVICPDCGGVVGAPGPGEVACDCRAEPGVDALAESPDSNETKSDTVSIATPSMPDAAAVEAIKPCAVCGRELAGHRRYKDSRGYVCPQCMKQEEGDKVAGKVSCPRCKRKVREAGIVTFNGRKMCRSCQLSLQESKKVLVHKVASKNYDSQEKRTVFILLGVVGVLVIFMILSLFKYRLWK